MRTISFRRPDDFHVHFRDGAVLGRVVPETASRFARAVVMPNLTPPVVTSADAAAYRRRVLAAVPAGVAFEPLMTLYLTDTTDASDLAAGVGDGIVFGAKLYPAHATTNSAAGVTDVARLDDVFARMAELGVPLMVHGEVTRPEVDIFDREARFVDEVFEPLMIRHPGLRAVMEHVTTAEGVAFVKRHSGRLAATVTPQHLMYDRNALFQGGLRPHLWCLPVLKSARHRAALRAAVTSGDPAFMLGTDTAPHRRSAKEAACCAAGIFSAPVAIEAYLQVFAEENALEHFEAFASLNGARFHGLPVTETVVTYVEAPRFVAEAFAPDGAEIAGDMLVSLLAGQSTRWRPAGTDAAA
jgi:dihydroorotase